MTNPRGRLFILSAPSGAGKSTLINRAVAELPRICHSVSATTRKPRSYEKDGVHYHFLDREKFHEMITHDGFLEWAQVFGEYYGTPCAEVDSRLAAGDDVIMDLDVQGALQVKRRVPDAILVFIMPPSIEELRHRLVSRGAESEELIERRLAMAEEEMSQRGLYDHVIVNDDLDKAFEELRGILRASSPPGGQGGGR